MAVYRHIKPADWIETRQDGKTYYVNVASLLNAYDAQTAGANAKLHASEATHVKH